MKEIVGARPGGNPASRKADTPSLSGAAKSAASRGGKGKWIQAYAARRRRNQILGAVGVAAAVMGAIALASLGNSGSGGLNTSLHQHMAVEIYINGVRAEVPADIGIDPALSNAPSLNQYGGGGTMAPIHTHDTIGKIHHEMRKWHACTLGDIFDIWGQPFDRDRVLDFVGPVSLQVNGQPNDNFRNLVLQDGQLIVIVAG